MAIVLRDSKTPSVVAIVTDASHAAEIQTEAQAMLPGCSQLHTALEVWKSDGDGFLIVLIPLHDTPIQIFVADGRVSLRRQITRAVRSLKGARTAWLRGLDDVDDAIVLEALGSLCARVSPLTLADIECEGAA